MKQLLFEVKSARIMYELVISRTGHVFHQTYSDPFHAINRFLEEKACIWKGRANA